MQPLGQYPHPSHTIAHISDTHLLAGGKLQYGVVDTVQHLQMALDRLRRIDPVPQAIVLTGDLADRGEPEAYAQLRSMIEPAAAAMGAQVVWCMGNHDDRTAYARSLFGADPTADVMDRVYEVDGLRIVALDTSVPNYHHGEITDEQHDWLASVLAEPAPLGTILAMHHPPIAIPMLPAAAIIELDGQDRLATALAGTDVRMILGGHFHYSSYGTFAGIPVSVASATCYISDIAPDQRFISAVDTDQSVNVLHVYDDTIVTSVVPTHDSAEISGFGSDVVPIVEAMSFEERRETFSRKDSEFNRGQEDPLVGA
ncbi:phosphodiesterase [Nocardioides islandensis]|uniref:Phosphodiesterase n=1 Tax=Nocardioides islandensis TaxID=433663 RepID=A0A930VDN3_9ACTN|nr:phosphodiesterase [Nocardioides islandensis]MBF4763681.1 phosphodiesterase [Nocardioides islandensis]